MIIMHPDNVIAPQQLMELASEVFVHPEIAGSVAVRQIGEVEAIMTNRPKRLIGEAAIILFDIAARKVADRIGERANSPAAGIAAALLAGLARPAEPESAVQLEHRFQCDRETARRGLRRG
jgi:hypothetical protein